MAAVALFRDTNMAAVTSRENTLYVSILLNQWLALYPASSDRPLTDKPRIMIKVEDQ